MKHIVNTISDLNELITRGKVNEFIHEEEQNKLKQIELIANEISQKKDILKWIWLAGPSSSGKTTFTNRLSKRLGELGIKTHPISLDNYFLNREITPLNEKGEHDYEHIHALDLPLLRQHLNHLAAGDEIEIPHFNFEKGCREFRGKLLHLSPHNIALIEGIHALNPSITSFAKAKHSFKIYICARTTLKRDEQTRISTSDNRLLRRMIRDHTFRGHTAKKTLSMWHSVRSGEKRWIFPFQPLAHREYNSALGYEYSILRPFAEPLLKTIMKNDKGYEKAQELLKFIRLFQPADDTLVPAPSILHEFIDQKPKPLS